MPSGTIISTCLGCRVADFPCMAASAIESGPPSSNAFARQRDARIRWLLDMHPVTAAMLVEIGWFPSKNKALKRLHRLVGRKQIRIIGTVCRKGGRPEHVYGRGGWVKTDQLLHEVELSQLCFRIHAQKVLRGPLVTDTARRPDAEVWINGHLYNLELDRGSMSYDQLVRTRFRKYEGSTHLVLWVCSSMVRREGLRQRAERLRSIALFTTLAEALADPHGAIWIDSQGETVALPRQGEEKGGEKAGEKGKPFPPPGCGGAALYPEPGGSC